MRELKFRAWHTVEKVKGYRFPGTVVATFLTTKGEPRYVVEMHEYGLLHIFNGEQLTSTINK